jgi:hypothetical protein
MYIPDQPFSLPTAPIRLLSLENGERVTRDLKGMEAITSPNYVTGLAAALLSKVSHSFLRMFAMSPGTPILRTDLPHFRLS